MSSPCFKNAVKILFGIVCMLMAVSLFPANSSAVQPEESDASPGPANFDKPPASVEEAKSQMHHMIQEDFSYWTGGGQRKLNIHDIGKLQKEPRLRGGQAALIGSLALAMDWRHGLVDRLSMEELLDLADGKTVSLKTTKKYAKHKGQVPDSVHLKSWPSEYQKEFASMASNVAADGLLLWGQASGPSLASIHQGQVGDCYWLSAVEAVVLKRPEIIKRTIRQTGPDTFELTFEGRDKPMRVRVTEADMAQFNTDRNDGCWLAALALGEARIKDEKKATGKFWKETSLGVLDAGGSQCQVLHLLTGRDYVSVRLKKSSDRRIADILEDAMQKDIPVGLTSKDHTLSIKSFDRSTDTVTILNPWGTSDKYKLPDSDEHVTMDKGMFQVSVGKMRRCFATLNVPESLAKR